MSATRPLSELCYVPMDYTPLDIDREKLLFWYDERSQRTTMFPRVRNCWNYVVFFHNNEWTPGILDCIPNFEKSLAELPFKKINYVGNFEQRPGMPVGEHTDVHMSIDGKNMKPDHVPEWNGSLMYGYRSWLVNDQPEDSFYVRIPNKNKIHPSWPEPVTGSWWNFAALNKNVLHGSNIVRPNVRKIVLIVNGIIDEERHASENYRCAEKFPHKTIWMDDPRFYREDHEPQTT